MHAAPATLRHRSPAGKAVRQLSQLQATGSSSRRLSLLSIWEKEQDNPEWRTMPFFSNQILNRAIIVKHRPRKDEEILFPKAVLAATKVILPFNIRDLRAGGRSFFVGQYGYENILEDLLGTGDERARDGKLLDLLNSLPSLDPFLMRETLRKGGFTPARCYFDVTGADLANMFAFAKNEIAPLVGLTFDEADADTNAKVVKLVDKILNAEDTDDLEPLRRGMGLDRAAFQDGVFSWKGFIYYKWSLREIAPSIRPVCQEILSARGATSGSDQEKAFIRSSKVKLARAITQTCEVVRSTLQVYDTAYHNLAYRGEPTEFRNFLLEAPTLFQELGERIGALQHIVSFWRYRYRGLPGARMPTEELFELFNDFTQSLSFNEAADGQGLRPAPFHDTHVV